MGELRANTLSECAFIGSITLSHGLTEIGERAFYNCRNLETVVIPETVTKIDRYAFTHSGLKSITLSHGVEIGEGAFHNCHNLVVNHRN